VIVAHVAKVMGSWESGLFIIGAAAAFGAILRIPLHPERPPQGNLGVQAARSPTVSDSLNADDNVTSGVTVSYLSDENG
jgi:ACS family glucarate transporter-like MFS transporter